MNAEEVEREVRRISARLGELDKETPEMSGMDWAGDHGWISHEEWEAAGEEAKAGVIRQDAEVARIVELRTKHPEAMNAFLEAHLQRLRAARDGLQRLADAAAARNEEFGHRFELILVPDIISCLEAWHRGQQPKHWPAWMWRVAFSVGEEVEAFVARETGP